MKKREHNEEKLNSDGISTSVGAVKWFDNFWYHYKWVTIGVAFALIVLVVCTVQMCSKEKEDLIMLYAGPTVLSSSEVNDVCDALEAVCPEDFDGNGQKQINLSAYYILSENQINEQASQTDENGENVYIDNSYNSDQYDTYYTYLMTGESSVLLLDPWLYERLAASDRLVSLTEALGYTPESAYGEYGIRLGETALYEQYGVMKLLPEDTVICLMRPYVAGNSGNEEYYAYEKKMFEALASFGD